MSPLPVGSTQILAARPEGPAVGRESAPTAKLRRTAEDFESLMLTQLLKGLRKTVPEGSEPSPTREMYQELFDEQLAVDLARNGGIGIARIIKSYLDQSGRAAAGTRPAGAP